MNETIRQLYDRKSVRVFTQREIAPEEKNAILTAAVNAPTAGNQQLYTIIDVTRQDLKERLAESCDHQPFIAAAKMVLIFCADCRKWYDAFLSSGSDPRRPGAGDLLLAVSDANIAAQNAVVAAQSLGIGSCYIGDIMENCEIHREMLGLPEYVFPAAMLVFGYPTEQQLQRAKPERVELRHVVHENGYRQMDGEELKAMFLPRCAPRSYEDWMEAFCTRKFNSDFAREMTRSVETYLRDFGLERQEKLTLKPISDGDRDAMLHLLTDETVKKTYMIPDVQAPDEVEKLFLRMKELSLSEDRYVVGIFLDERLIGFINDTEILGDTIEVGYVIDPAVHNRGYGTRALRKAVDVLFRKGFRQVMAGAFEENLPSIRVMIKSGMTKLDRQDEVEYRGKVHRCVYYAIREA